LQTHTYQSPRLALRLLVEAVRARDEGLRNTSTEDAARISPVTIASPLRAGGLTYRRPYSRISYLTTLSFKPRVSTREIVQPHLAIYLPVTQIDVPQNSRYCLYT
jgi:hypothetical protein